jgi:hypothetical protein
MRVDSGKWCKDCVAAAEGRPLHRRPTYWPGPRCTTHHRIERRRRQAAAHGRMVAKRYEITAELYTALYEAQEGRCALCRIATGKTKRLAVDHDHDAAKLHDHPVDAGCRLCIRGLLCGRCNRYGVPLNILAVARAVEYLRNPPARRVLINAETA